MNIADSEIVASILSNQYEITDNSRESDLVLLNTCSVRDNAEQRIRKRLRELKSLKKKNPQLLIGLLGCMAERIKEDLLEQEEALDFIAGPDAYRSLPQIIEDAAQGELSFNCCCQKRRPTVKLYPNAITTMAFPHLFRLCEGVTTSVPTALCLTLAAEKEVVTRNRSWKSVAIC